jgi:RNA polymerase sigma-70 factor (ECF subfamily)
MLAGDASFRVKDATMASDDSELLDKWRTGDELSGQELFRRHFDCLYRFFHNKVHMGTEDLVQQTLLACLESHQNFAARSSFKTYLLGIARYQLYDHYRRQRSDLDKLEFNTVTMLDVGMSPSAHAAQAGEQRVLLEALRRLPINLQIAVELAYWEDLSGPELAEILELPVDTVYTRLRRAKELLRQHIEELSDSDVQLKQTHSNIEQWATRMRDLQEAEGELRKS